jgi:glycerol-3-phosphate acyltransferase PlsY
MFAIVLIVAAYLVGSIPVGVLVGRSFGIDPRAVGSGNVGMTNVARAAGRGAAIVTFAGDFLKGALPVLAARALGADTTLLALAAFAAFAGSICSVFLGFGGGRGVSTSLGIWLALAPIATLIAFAIFAVALAITRIVSFGSVCAAIAMPVLIFAMGLPRAYLMLVIVMAILVLLRHRDNLRRLVKGEEPRLGERAA